MSALSKIRFPWARGDDDRHDEAEKDASAATVHAPAHPDAPEQHDDSAAPSAPPTPTDPGTPVVRPAAPTEPVPPAPAPPAPQKADPEDVARNQVAGMLEGWRQELVDLTADGPTTAFIELSAAHPTGVAQLFAGRPTRLSILVREPGALAHAQSQARHVKDAQRLMVDSHGVGPVYLAIGTVSWTEGSQADNLRTGAAAHMAPGTPAMPERISGPALLCPVKLDIEEDGDVVIRREPAVSLWGPLEAALKRRGAGDQIEAVLAATAGAHGFTTTRALSELRQIGTSALVSFDQYDSLTIGQYEHPVRDAIKVLDDTAEKLADSPVLRAFAGVEGADKRVWSQLPTPQPADRDPRAEHGVGDLEPNQHDALDAVATGAHLFLNTPAGATSAATVLAILVDQILAGRRVAYVAGTTQVAQALVAEARLRGVENMVADFTQPDWQSQVSQRVLDALNQPEVDVTDPQITQLRTELTRVRADLGGYMDRLHERKAPWGVSAYDCLQVLTDLTSGSVVPRTRVRFSPEVLTKIGADGADRARAVIDEADRLGIIRKTQTVSPWHRVLVKSPDAVDHVVEQVRHVSDQTLAEVLADIDQTVRETGLRHPETLADWQDQLHMLEGVRDSLDVFKPQIFEASAADMVIATASKKWREERSIHMKGGQRRRLVKQAREYVRDGRTVEDLHAELIRVQEQRRIWRDYTDGGGYPVLPEGLARMQADARDLGNQLRDLEPELGPSYEKLAEWPLAVLDRQLGALADDDEAIELLPERVTTLAEIHELGLDALIDDLRERGVPASKATAELDLAWWASALSHLLHSDKRLATFDGDTLEELVEKLGELDLAQVNSLSIEAQRTFRTMTARRLERRRAEAEQLRLAIESGSVGGLMHAVGVSSLGRSLVPLQIIPPALVAQFVGGDEPTDLVIFEGIETTPEGELAAALGEARQVVVVGDSRRGGSGLVPTASGMFPSVTLPIRGQRVNGVVAKFLADHGLGAEIEQIAQPSHPAGIEFVLLDGRGMPAPGVNAVESTATEVAKVVGLVIAHALERPDESLGVVAFNERHAQRLREAVISAVADSPAIDSFFTSNRPEPFVVVPLERCAGMTRDRVICSIGYGKTPHGRVIHDFGAVVGESGPSFLVNALVTTRGDLTIVTSLDPDEVDITRIPTEGATMLYDLLKLAKYAPKDRSPLEIARDLDEEEGAPDRLLVDLAERLYSLGLTVVPNVGPAEGLQIPLAIGHPDLPDDLLVAVLTDNERYVNERSLRRRDRLWAQKLQEYGWVTHMVFSTAVFMDPQGEAERILQKVLDVVEERTAPDRAMPEVPDQIDDTEFGLDASAPAAEPVADQPVEQRVLRPRIARGLPMAAYSDDQLDDLLAWIRSDGVDRSVDEEVEELAEELGLTRRGAQIDAILAHVARRGRDE